MERYESYKDSGVDWLGEIPAHWSTLRAKFVFREIDDRSVSGDEELLSVSHLTGVTPRSEKNITMFMAEDYTGAKLCHEGDLVINTMWAWMGALGVSPLEGIVSPAYGVYRQHRDGLLPKFADWLFRTPDYVAEYTRRSTGVNSSRLRLYPDQFLDLPVLVPPLEDQERIVAFLDQKTAEIDAAIAKKERLIELLQEQKSILINQAVTRGLNPDVPLRDSGVEWIGQIPAHWSLSPVYGKFDVRLGKMLDAKRITGKSLLRYLRNTDVQWSGVNTEDLPMMDIHPLEYDRYTVRKGDLLVCEGGEVGRCSIWDGDTTVGFQKALHRVRPIAAVNVRYFRFFMMAASFAGELASSANTSTIAHLTCEMFRRMRFVCPPEKEQQDIADFLVESEAKVQESIECIRREIGAIQELRSGLIASAVTGKIKV